MNVLQHTRNELNLCLKENRPDRSYRDTLLRDQIAWYEFKGDLSPVMLKEVFHDSFENFKLVEVCGLS